MLFLIGLKHLLQYLAQPSPFSGKDNICVFNQKSKYLKADVFVISSNFVLASKKTTRENHINVKSIDLVDFDLYHENGVICRAKQTQNISI